jgi:hypothetical protein
MNLEDNVLYLLGVSDEQCGLCGESFQGLETERVVTKGKED